MNNHIYLCPFARVVRVRVAHVGHAAHVGRVCPGCASVFVSCRMICAVLGFRGPCRVEISVLACPCRVGPALTYE